MMTLLITAAALVGTTSTATMTGPAEGAETETIVVEGRPSEGDWVMPKLDYDEPASCPAFVETEIPGFGALRLRNSCAEDRTEEWRLFQY